jgi:hypothetical protein
MAEWIKTFVAAHPSVPFALTCGGIGLIVVVIDLLVFKLQGNSFLKLGYPSTGKTVGMLLLWGLGAALVGWLGAVAQMLQLNMQAALAVGGGWPAIVPRLISTAGKEVEQK